MDAALQDIGISFRLFAALFDDLLLNPLFFSRSLFNISCLNPGSIYAPGLNFLRHDI